MNLSKRQQAILNFIKSYTDEHGYPPALSEIGEGVNLASKSTVHGHLERLRDKGIVAWEYGLPRTLRVVKEA